MTTFAQVLDGVLRSQSEAHGPPPMASRGPTFDEIDRALGERLALLGGPRRPRWAVELDVELPCDASAARRAFRRRALQTHPDRPGGSHEAFLRSQWALDEALLAAAGTLVRR